MPAHFADEIRMPVSPVNIYFFEKHDSVLARYNALFEAHVYDDSLRGVTRFAGFPWVESGDRGCCW